MRVFIIFFFFLISCTLYKGKDSKDKDLEEDIGDLFPIETFAEDLELWEPPEGCIDNDHDTYGEGCPNGPDCDDKNPYFNTTCPDCIEKIVQGCPCNKWSAPIACFEGDEKKKNVGLCKEGSRYCENGFWSECKGQVLPEDEKCDGSDNDCDGEKDEDIIYIDWDGSEKKLGETCGTGVCEGGMVICGKGAKSTCSSLDKATPSDLCIDGIDNDCNGEIDEDCEPPEDFDFDGDGYKSPEDCNPYKAEIHPKAKEPCCPPSLPLEEAIAKCDFNCDGQITHCDGNDKDFDGVLPPDDCNDGDAKIYKSAPEKCGNGIDEDCNGGDLGCEGLNDGDADGFPPPLDCNDNNSEINPWAGEICNKIDDNCDGVVDEGNPGGGEKCGLEIGECKPGINVCVQFPIGSAVKCVGGFKGEEEKCDGKDNDCDGGTDEDFPDLNQPCDGDDPDLCKNATYICKEDGSGVICGEESVKNILEVCDNIDNDCDGETDEICFPADVDGDGFSFIDDCNDFLAEFNPGAKQPCCPPYIKEDEILKKCDLNCDGKVQPCDENDKDFDGFLPPEDCNDNDGKIYKGAPEKCGNGIDENCDGSDSVCNQVVDKDKDGYSPPEDCNDNNPEIYPWAKEKCNFIDDDCNGVIDDGDPESNDESCGSSTGGCKPGKTHCVHFPYSAKLVCIPQVWAKVELCDNIDNDCDGETDEDFPDLGKPCDGKDSDLCQRGSYTCSPDGNGIECVNEVVENITELCDFFDNDCDGETDEGMVYEGKKVGEKCDGVGNCGEGVVECSKDKKSAICSTNPGGSKYQGTEEECDGVDNDCDGETDEGIPKQKSPCKFKGICSPDFVKVECPDGKWICDYSLISFYEENEKSCDGLDNDCDGKIDEEIPLWSSPCKFEGVCSPELVKAECKKGQWFCDYSKIPLYEDEEKSCDEYDNDCNGIIDDLNSQKGKKCEGKYTDGCATGIFKCKPDKSGVECKDDIPCAPQSSCMKSVDELSPDTCVCGDKSCTIKHGNKCINNECLCYYSPACNPPETYCNPLEKKCTE